jgi:hypothetical protein
VGPLPTASVRGAWPKMRLPIATSVGLPDRRWQRDEDELGAHTHDAQDTLAVLLPQVVIPTRHDRILLPPGAGLEPRLWFDDDPAWLGRALGQLGQPRLKAVQRAS